MAQNYQQLYQNFNQTNATNTAFYNYYSGSKEYLKWHAHYLEKQYFDALTEYNETKKLLDEWNNTGQEHDQEKDKLEEQLKAAEMTKQQSQNEYQNYVNYFAPYYDVSINTDGHVEGDWDEKKQTYTDSEVNQINELLNGLKSNNLTVEEANQLNSILKNKTDDSDLKRNIVSNMYRYNIDDSLNDQLIDVRNYYNFRNSNNAHKEQNNGHTTYDNQFINGTNASRSFYMSKNDFYWSQNYNEIYLADGNEIEHLPIQNIILNEYQPQVNHNLGKQLIDIGVSLIDGLAELVASKSKGFGKVALDVIGKGAEVAANQWMVTQINKELVDLSKNPSKLYNQQSWQGDNKIAHPMYYVQRLFTGGRWLNTYQLPFVAGGKVKTDYIKNAQNSGNWSIGGLTDSVTDSTIGNKIIQDRISLTIPTAPTFQLQNPNNATYGSFSIDFYLINKNDDYLAKNFQFLHAIFAGTQWLLLKIGAVVAPNVYHVVVPGRFEIPWAGMNMAVQSLGRLRINDYMYARYGSSVKSVQSDTLWPQVWHLALTINPLTQWNFNTYIDYHSHGYGQKQKKRLAKNPELTNVADDVNGLMNFSNSKNNESYDKFNKQNNARTLREDLDRRVNERVGTPVDFGNTAEQLQNAANNSSGSTFMDTLGFYLNLGMEDGRVGANIRLNLLGHELNSETIRRQVQNYFEDMNALEEEIRFKMNHSTTTEEDKLELQKQLDELERKRTRALNNAQAQYRSYLKQAGASKEMIDARVKNAFGSENPLQQRRTFDELHGQEQQKYISLNTELVFQEKQLEQAIALQEVAREQNDNREYKEREKEITKLRASIKNIKWDQQRKLRGSYDESK